MVKLDPPQVVIPGVRVTSIVHKVGVPDESVETLKELIVAPGVVLVIVWTPSENENDIGEMGVSGRLFARGVARSKEPDTKSLVV